MKAPEPKTPEPKTPEPKAPELQAVDERQAGKLETTIPGYAQPPAGGSVGPPPSQSPFTPASNEKTPKGEEKAHEKAPDEKAPAHKENDRDKSHHR